MKKTFLFIHTLYTLSRIYARTMRVYCIFALFFAVPRALWHCLAVDMARCAKNTVFKCLFCDTSPTLYPAEPCPCKSSGNKKSNHFKKRFSLSALLIGDDAKYLSSRTRKECCKSHVSCVYSPKERNLHIHRVFR